MDPIVEQLVSAGIVPVFNHRDAETGCRVVQACYDGGLRVFEWTNRGADAADRFRDVRAYADEHCPGMLLGAGSVFDGDGCRKFKSLGASFIVSPVVDPDMARTCRELDIPWIPGCGTATEIHQAGKWGATLVKVFPGDSVGGPAFVKAVLAPMPWARIMPTGGVGTDYANLKSWFDAGIACVGLGSKLFTPELINDPGALTRTVSNLLQILSDLRRKD